MAHHLPGLCAAALLAFGSIELAKSEVFAAHGISALTLAIALGMLVGNTVYPRFAGSVAPGIGFSKQKLLRLGIVLYGLRLTFQDIGHVGVLGVAIDTVMLCSTFGLACLLGTRLFGLDRTTAMLIGAGSSICGAAAVMATEPVVRGRAEQVTVAVSTVVVFGTIAIFLYPALYAWNLQHGLLPMGQKAYGLFVGSTVHEVAQVVAAGRAVGEGAADTAVIAKMVRVMMLAPFLLALSAWLARGDKAGAGEGGPGDGTPAAAGGAGALCIPWFAVAFVVVAGFNSLGLLPASVVGWILDLDTVLLAMAMAALGLTTHFSAIRNAGLKPLALAATLFLWLVVGGCAVNQALGAWIH
ncbi:MAG: YeiH family protein [Pseudomonadota bacterium]